MKRILVIEDDPEVARLVELELKEAGFAVEWAKSGMEGLVRHRERKPDLVVLDLGLPDLDGAEVARRIRATDDTPILVLTAQDAVERKVGLLAEGADDYLVKPFHPAELLARIQVQLRHKGKRGPGGGEAGALPQKAPGLLRRGGGAPLPQGV